MDEIEVFTAQWAERLAQALNADTKFKEASGDWVGVLGLAMTHGRAERRTTVLDLARGRCIRTCSGEDSLVPDYVIEAKEKRWREVFDGKLDPAWGLMSGKLRLSKGSVSELISVATAALRIVECARTIPSIFPTDRSSARTAW